MRSIKESSYHWTEAIYQGYIEALFWAEIPRLDNDDEENQNDDSLSDLGYTDRDLLGSSHKLCVSDCAKMLHLIMANKELKHKLEYDWVQVGRDLYFTRQSHGTGFWDRPSEYGEDCGVLDKIVEQNFKEIYTWVDEDGKVGIE